ncbi:uncharacterized protein LOC18421390 [Amborella trichopoda]|uniref:Uncharacterized protein n=1 Tax=Amborella trichopoda TaxID=13333 RepID=W1NDR8_AMBTC|nr:uncharacterized protein LOC18421390 [Amborella trichopoda]ERM93488.1 hypothetical protein AMTR_s00004p00017950 [Amborella trichopoda]|eukprot:XP_020521654.1 uncharacterized protein LOC18421390 [Amborella trichopoda]
MSEKKMREGTKKSMVWNTTTPPPTRGAPETSSYFPNCLKSANCNCEMCLASISATLDLLPNNSSLSSSISSLSPLTLASPSHPKTPIRRNSLCPRPNIAGSALRSTAKSRPIKSKTLEDAKSWVNWKICGFLGLVLVLGLMGLSGLGLFPFKGFRPSLTAEMVGEFGLGARIVTRASERMNFVGLKLEKILPGQVKNCSSLDSIWTLNQDGLLLCSRCVLYESMAEEVSVWGWPLKTAGVLAAGFSDRSLTILSGRLLEWPEGKLEVTVRGENSSWTQKRWSSSVAELHPMTWLLEYRRHIALQNANVFRVAYEFLSFTISTKFKELKKKNLGMMLPFSPNLYLDHAQGDDAFRFPT